MRNKEKRLNTPYEVWDNGNANIVFAYETQEEALADIRETILLNGAESVESWVLLHDDYQSTAYNIAVGSELAALALGVAPSRAVAD